MTDTVISRRKLIGATAMAGAAITAAEAAGGQPVTARQTEGPFYPTKEQSDKDADLTRVAGRGGAAKGEVVLVEGHVFDEYGAPIAGAVVDIWQANAAGRYAHERDPNPAPLDPDFQGWAILATDDAGRYGFKTIRPGAYPAEKDWARPPHIHFKVSRRGYREITTQMYFENEPLNDIDRLLQNIPEPQRSALIARRADDTQPFRFNVVLAKA